MTALSRIAFISPILDFAIASLREFVQFSHVSKTWFAAAANYGDSRWKIADNEFQDPLDVAQQPCENCPGSHQCDRCAARHIRVEKATQRTRRILSFGDASWLLSGLCHIAGMDVDGLRIRHFTLRDHTLLSFCVSVRNEAVCRTLVEELGAALTEYELVRWINEDMYGRKAESSALWAMERLNFPSYISSSSSRQTAKPLPLAARRGRLDIFKLLLKQPFWEKLNDSQTALRAAVDELLAPSQRHYYSHGFSLRAWGQAADQIKDKEKLDFESSLLMLQDYIQRGGADLFARDADGDTVLAAVLRFSFAANVQQFERTIALLHMLVPLVDRALRNNVESQPLHLNEYFKANVKVPTLQRQHQAADDENTHRSYVYALNYPHFGSNSHHSYSTQSTLSTPLARCLRFADFRIVKLVFELGASASWCVENDQQLVGRARKQRRDNSNSASTSMSPTEVLLSICAERPGIFADAAIDALVRKKCEEEGMKV